MAENKKKDEILQKNLAHLKKRALDVKFDLDLTEYTPIENIGIGAYGVVCSAIHKKTNDRVAIKKIPGVFDYKEISKRTYREIKILKHFSHDNVIQIREILKPKETLKDFRDIYVVFDLMESDLHKIIYSKQDLTEEHVRYFLYQILRGLKYIHSADVIHRDLKPSNLLVNEDCQLRIGDFGMARGISSSAVEPNYFMTQYVATRWYRAPEIMLSLIEYGAAVDMWSVGCIFAEMLGRKHLFPGKDSISQIKLIVGLIGTPKENLVQLCQSPIIKNFIKGMGQKSAVPLPKLYPKASKKALNLLGRMLVLHPGERLTVEQALVHPYLNKYHDPDDEPICVPVFNFDFEKEELQIPQLRDAINTEIMEYHKPRTPTLSFNAFLKTVPKTLDSKFPSKDSDIKGIEHQATTIKGDVTVKEEAGSLSSDKPSCSHQIVITEQTEDDVFKRPLSAHNKDTKVHVDTDNLLKTESSDIEMLSAKSTDGKPMSAVVKDDKTKENTDPGMDDKNKTISEGTKSLIKAAIMNESFKKRTDSVGEDERPRPVTAAMRQKEREDKRKKKKEKTLERKRKEKRKNEARDEILTSEDKELLQRWTKMQHVNVPIAPKPPDPTAGVTGQGQPDSVKPGDPQGQGDKGAKTELQSFPTNQRNVQQGTLNLLQQRLLANAGTDNSNSNISNHKDTAQMSLVTMPTDDQNMPSARQGGDANNETYVNQPKIQLEGDSGTVGPESGGAGPYSVDFSNVNLGDLDFLTMLSSPEVTSILTQSMPNDGQMTMADSGIKQFEDVRSHVAPSIDPGSLPGSLLPEQRTNFLQQLCADGPSVDNRGLANQAQPQQSTNQLSVSPNYPSHVSPPQFFPGHSPGSQHSLSPNHLQGHDLSPNQQNISPNPHFPAQQQTNLHPAAESSQAFPGQMLHTHVNNVPFHDTSLDINNINPSNLFMSSSQDQAGAVSQSDQAFGYRNQSTAQQEVYRNQSTTQQEVQSSSNSNSPPALSINVQEAQMSMRHIFQEPVAGTSEGHQIQDTHVDLVTLLSKQFSKSNVDDLCPQLALTPRGTGGGYGVGVDLDALMVAQEADGQPPAEPSPLSSSILADWMEVTGNMNIDMEALEQELQSPMALSYNDLNLYSS